MADPTEATNLKAIDTALAARYSGLSIDIDTGSGPTSTTIEVFMEAPHPEIVPERVYPSISLRFLAMILDDRRSHTDDDLPEDVGDRNTVPAVFEQDTRLAPQPYRITYTLDTWHKDLVGEDRDLIQTVAMATPPRGNMSVLNVDGDTIEVFVLWDGGMVTADEFLPDTVIYHKSTTIDVLAYLLLETNKTTEKLVMELEWGVSCIKLVTDNLGNISIDETGEVEDIRFLVLEDGEQAI